MEETRRTHAIGLTGGIGSGKSTVSRIFRDLGVPALSADQISRELVAPGSPLLQQIVDTFGTDIQNSDGSLDRTGLARVVFNNPDLRKTLESILHPSIRKTMSEAVSALTGGYCILEIPLLVETGQWQTVERVLVVTSDPKTNLERLTSTRNLTEQEVQQVMSTQLTDHERIQYADDVLKNDDTLEELAEQVEKLHTFYSSLFGRCTSRSTSV